MNKVGKQLHAGRAISCVLVLVIFLMPASALAKTSPGVHVDPGSPAAKEYQVPLGAARGNGTSGTGNTQPLFGSGITKTPAPASTPTTATTTPAVSKVTHAKKKQKHHTNRQHKTRHAAAAPVTKPPTPRAPSPARAIGTSSGSSIGWTWMLGAAVIVVLLGAAGGIALARRGRGTRSPYPS
jgi:hypothetical protein